MVCGAWSGRITCLRVALLGNAGKWGQRLQTLFFFSLFFFGGWGVHHRQHFGCERTRFQTFGAATRTWETGIMKASCERIIGPSVQPGCFLRMCCQLLETSHPSGISDGSRSPFEQLSGMRFSLCKRDTACSYSGFPWDGKCGW